MRKILLYLLVFIILIVLAIVGLRNHLLHYGLNKLTFQLQHEYGYNLRYTQTSFISYNEIVIRGITIHKDTLPELASISECHFRIHAGRLIRGEWPLDGLHIDTCLLSFYKDGEYNNYIPIKAITPKAEKKSTNQKALSHFEIASKVIRIYRNILESDYTINRLEIDLNMDGWNKQVNIHSLQYADKRITGYMNEGISNEKPYYHLHGSYDERFETFLINVNRKDTDQSKAVFTYRNALADLKSMQLKINILNNSNKSIQAEIDWNIDSLFIRHWRINADGFYLNTHGKADIQANKNELKWVCEKFVINNVPAFTTIRYTIENERILESELRIKDVSSMIFFNAISSFFNSLKGFECSGTTQYLFQTRINFDTPDSSYIKSDLDLSNYQVKKFSRINFYNYDSTFEHQVYDNDRFIRTLTIGPSNPHFTSYQDIPSSLIQSVLLSEDASFLHHRGFNEEAINHSLQSNMKQKRFARGGSTITMQLVKNLFLNRDKTIFRKMEEAMLVWLLENKNYMSKERMLEIYLNIIEWGPDVYGIGEAAMYYFNKQPAELTLSESIWLSFIIPNPKKYYYSLNNDFSFKPYYTRHFELIIKRMLSKKMITESDTLHLQSNIEFGPNVWLPGKTSDTILSVPDKPIDLLEENN